MYHLPQAFQRCKGEAALKYWEEEGKEFSLKKKSRHKCLFVGQSKGAQRVKGGGQSPVWMPAPHLFLAARGFRLIFFDLSLFFFGGSGFACMCLP